MGIWGKEVGWEEGMRWDKRGYGRVWKSGGMKKRGRGGMKGGMGEWEKEVGWGEVR